MTFGDEAKSVATSLPDDYQPAVFTNSALQCSSVYLTLFPSYFFVAMIVFIGWMTLLLSLKLYNILTSSNYY